MTERHTQVNLQKQQDHQGLNTENRSVIIVDDSAGRSSLLKRAFTELGFNILACFKSASEISNFDIKSDLLVIGVEMPDNPLLELLSFINKESPLPIIVFAEHDTPEVVSKVVSVGVNAFIVNDIQPSRILSIVNIATARFEERQQLKSELSEAKNKLKERKVIDRAKGLIMAHKKVDEPSAYSSLRKMAMDKGVTLAVAAKGVIDVLSMLEDDLAV